MLKKIGSWVGSAKRYIRDVQSQVTEITNETLDTDSQSSSKTDDKKELNDK